MRTMAPVQNEEKAENDPVTKTRRDRLYLVGTMSNSNKTIAQMVDAFLDKVDAVAKAETKTTAVNRGRDTDLNPLAGNRKNMQIAQNKTPKY